MGRRRDLRRLARKLQRRHGLNVFDIEDKTIGIVKGIAGIVLFGGLVVLVARYNGQLGSFLNQGAGALVTLGNGVANFGGSGAGISVSG